MILAAAWRDALAELEVRHPNGWSRVLLRIDDGDPPVLFAGLDETTCTVTGAAKRDFTISCVRLTYWPGMRLAHAWIAAAWAGYCQHEALELVTLAGNRSARVLDPHFEPYATNPINRGLRDGFPPVLTPETLIDTLALVMPRQDAERLAMK